MQADQTAICPDVLSQCNLIFRILALLLPVVAKPVQAIALEGQKGQKVTVIASIHQPSSQACAASRGRVSSICSYRDAKRSSGSSIGCTSS